MTDRSPRYPRLRPVPESTKPTMIEPPDPDDYPAEPPRSSEWRDGWNACRETLGEEWRAWYKRGLEARPLEGGSVVIVLGAAALSGFVVGFILAIAAFA